MSYSEPYRSYPMQRTRTVFTVDGQAAALVKRRPIELIRAIDEQGDWVFGLELRVINEIVLAKIRALAPDGVTVSVSSCALPRWPESLEIRHAIQALGNSPVGSALITFGDHELELDTVPNKLMEFRTYAPDERELICPWVTLALTA